MGKYDAILKAILQRWNSVLLHDIMAEPVAHWHTPELPQLTVQYSDLLVETPSKRLWHIELQSRNDPAMPIRMLEYAVRIHRMLDQFPKQAVLYVGNEPMRMDDSAASEDLAFRYELVDARGLNRDILLASDSAGDNVMAILTGLRTSPELVRHILQSIARLNSPDRELAFEALLILAGLRELEETVEGEAKRMPVFEDILDHKVLGREYKRGREEGRSEGREEGRSEGREEGRAEGREEGREEGRQDGELRLIRVMFQRRFGTIPASIEAKLSAMTPPELEDLAQRLMGASTLDELFR